MSEKKLFCKMCGVDINDDNSTKIPGLFRCRECYNQYTQTRYRKIGREKQYWGGDLRIYSSSQVKNKPGEWCDDKQKKEVTDILNAIGWKYNEKNGIWFDDKIRDKEGKWLKELNGISKIYTSKYRTFIKENNIKIPKIDYTVETNNSNVFTPEEIQRIQKLYFLENYPKKSLVEIFNADVKHIEWVIMTTLKRLRPIFKEYEG